MFQIDFQNPCHVHFIGIGGISMSGLSEMLLNAGFTVSGSDVRPSDLTEHLKERGVLIYDTQSASNLSTAPDVVVYTAAIHPDNPELAAAKERSLPLLTRAELLGQIMANYPVSCAVSGTHGKTTTTSMITEILLRTELDPTISVGGILPSIGGNYRVGKGDLFVTEACEYTNSFLSLSPTYGIILNVEEDHPDFFSDLSAVRRSFRAFAERIPADGSLIIHAGIENLKELTDGLACSVITFGLSDSSDYYAEDISWNEEGHPSFTVMKREKDQSSSRLFSVTLPVPGSHNIVNALAASAFADRIGVSPDTMEDGLSHFSGTERRFEKKGVRNGVTVIDDYAHHPQEIAATLQAAKRMPHRKIWCVFQPHTYSRTKAYLDGFAESLSLADEVVLADIYAARETDTLGISTEDIAVRLRKRETPVTCLHSFSDIEKFLLKKCIHGDLLITMGAGDIVKVGESFLKD